MDNSAEHVKIEGNAYITHRCSQSDWSLITNREQQCPTYPELKSLGIELYEKSFRKCLLEEVRLKQVPEILTEDAEESKVAGNSSQWLEVGVWVWMGWGHGNV